MALIAVSSVFNTVDDVIVDLFDSTLFTNYMLQMGDFRHLQL